MRRAGPIVAGLLPFVALVASVACDGGAVATQPDGAIDPPRSEGGADGATSPPAVRFVGRFDTSDPAGARVAWPGARIIARFSGTEVKVALVETAAAFQPSQWDVSIDGTLDQKPLSLNLGQSTYPLATGLAPGIHTVELTKRTEAKAGVTQFLGFDFAGGQLLAPPPAPGRLIEFLGDSNTTGYGIEGAGPGCPYTVATQNERKAFDALAATALAADHHTIAYTGLGVLFNYDRSDPNVMEVLYPRALPDSPGSAYDFTAAAPDVVWISFGSNDWENAPPPTLSAFQTKYDDLVALVRAKRPSAHLVCALDAALSDDFPAGVNAFTSTKTAINNVVSARTAAGDKKIYSYEYVRAADTDRTGCDYHFNPAKHQSLADETVAFIKSKTGW